MKIINSMLFWFMKNRINQIEFFKKEPAEAQMNLLSNLLLTAAQTEIGKKYDFQSIDSHSKFKENVPLVHYEEFEPYIERTRKGEENVIWPGKIKWFAKSSGTTNAKSKYIPITKESLNDSHYKAGKDMFSLYTLNVPDTAIFTLKNLRLGGSAEMYEDYGSSYGDLSAILIDNLPFWVEMKNIPDKKISLMSEWEAKMRAIIDAVKNQNVGSLTGVPSWMMVLLQNIMQEEGVSSIHEIWPNLEVFFHGGISFKPYRQEYNSITKKPIHYFEIYNASEGFFAVRDEIDRDDMLLLLDHGIFYEFIPMEEFHKENPKVIDISEVELGKNYALVISTNGGLWRYIIGDTIMFTSTIPHRIKVTGRTKHFINTFGEELIIDNAEEALQYVQSLTNSSISDFTAGPIYMEGKEKGGHEWIIEFVQEPENLEDFAALLDQKLQALNSDYEAKRYKNITLNPLILHAAPKGFFHNWMKERGKLGGQNKVPRLANDRLFLDPLLDKMYKLSH